MVKRRYEQRLRAQAAEDTRRRILDAAYARLREAPTQPLSVDAVARGAGVARSTVYLVFGSRAGLFEALGDDLLRQEAYERLVEAGRLPDARASLRAGLRAASEMFAADRDVARALYSMAQLDGAAVAGAIGRWEEERARGTGRLARRLGEQGLLRSGVTVGQAADILWVLTSFDSFDALFTGRGLSLDEAVDALTATAERALLGEPGAP